MMKPRFYIEVTIPSRDLWSRIKNVFHYKPRIIEIRHSHGVFMIGGTDGCTIHAPYIIGDEMGEKTGTISGVTKKESEPPGSRIGSGDRSLTTMRKG